MNLEIMGQVVERFIFLPFFFLIIIFLLMFFLIGVFLCVWVYRDAQSKGMDGSIWIIIILIANVMGLIVYLVVREDRIKKSMYIEGIKYCSYCGHQISRDAMFCENCGKKVASQDLK